MSFSVLDIWLSYFSQNLNSSWSSNPDNHLIIISFWSSDPLDPLDPQILLILKSSWSSDPLDPLDPQIPLILLILGIIELFITNMILKIHLAVAFCLQKEVKTTILECRTSWDILCEIVIWYLHNATIVSLLLCKAINSYVKTKTWQEFGYIS